MSKVLIADDDRTSSKLLESLLQKWGYQVEAVHNGDDALRELLKPDAPQLAILDWMMPGLQGIEVIRRVRAAPRDFYTYALLLTSKGQKEDLLEGLEAGADDYLKKPYDAAELRARLLIGARILGLERRLASAMEAPEYRAAHDPLTGLHNRNAIVEVLGREVQRCDRVSQKVSALLVEIDHCKAVIETYGQKECEQVIKLLAPKMSSDLRPHDSVGRYGAEQFLVVAPNCSLSHAMVVAERIRLTVAKDKVAVGRTTIPVTVSIAIGAVKAAGQELHLVLQEAESALQRVKRDGRGNRVECFAAETAAQSAAGSKSG